MLQGLLASTGERSFVSLEPSMHWRQIPELSKHKVCFICRRIAPAPQISLTRRTILPRLSFLALYGAKAGLSRPSLFHLTESNSHLLRWKGLATFFAWLLRFNNLVNILVFVRRPLQTYDERGLSPTLFGGLWFSIRT